MEKAPAGGSLRWRLARRGVRAAVGEEGGAFSGPAPQPPTGEKLPWAQGEDRAARLHPLRGPEASLRGS